MPHLLTIADTAYQRDLMGLRRSHYYGYWLRLNSLGFKFVGTRIKNIAQNDKVYVQTCWKFTRDDESLFLYVSRLRVKLKITVAGKCVLKKSFVSGEVDSLETVFLDYFNQPEKFLFIRRSGWQQIAVKKFQRKWLEHIKEKGRWAKKLKQMGVFDSCFTMPVQTHKPRPREYKPRKGLK